MNNAIIDGKKIRVDYSKTLKPHDPTPGRYYGPRNKYVHSATTCSCDSSPVFCA